MNGLNKKEKTWWTISSSQLKKRITNRLTVLWYSNQPIITPRMMK